MKKEAEAADDKRKEIERDKDKEPLDTFIPQAIKAAPRTCKQESREQGCSSSKALDVSEVDVNQQVSEVDINQQVIEKEAGDLEVTVDEEEKKSKGKEDIEKKEQVELVKEEVTHKEGWMRRKWKKRRRSENQNRAAPPADDIAFSPTGEPAKVV